METSPEGRLVVVVVWDGLRPDFLTPEVTPTLLGLAGGGVWFGASHCVYPSETRVNASALATGCGPGRTGITANSIYVPGFDSERPDVAVNTGDHTQLARLEALDGPLLRVPWVGQAIEAAGGAMVVASSGSPGSALLQDPSPGGTTVNQAILRPEPVAAAVLARFGAPPPDSFPATGRSDWVTRALLEYLLPEVLLPRVRAGRPALAHWWLTDPDHTAHHLGLGVPETVRSLGENDRRLAALMARLDDLGLLERTDVLLTSDHGFSTPGPPAGPGRDFRAALAAAAGGPGAESGAGAALFDTGQGGGAITFGAEAAGRAPAVVRWLLGQPWVGAVLARDGGPAAGLPGTLPLSLAWGGRVGARAPDLRFSPLWSDAPNPAGVIGAVAGRPAGGRLGATHGSASPYDMRNSLFAWGPRFKRGLRSDVPAGVVDVAPTVRHLLGLPGAAADGRVLAEALAGGPAPETVEVVRTAHEAAAGGLRQRLRRASVGGTSYLEGVDAWRE
jgi:arylsulfatase A-like enzyme